MTCSLLVVFRVAKDVRLKYFIGSRRIRRAGGNDWCEFQTAYTVFFPDSALSLLLLLQNHLHIIGLFACLTCRFASAPCHLPSLSGDESSSLGYVNHSFSPCIKRHSSCFTLNVELYKNSMCDTCAMHLGKQ